jgi:hypothetical protein
MYKQGLFWNFLSLIDMRNYIKQDNLSSAKHVEKVGLMQKLLEGLGFASPMDAREKDFQEFLTRFRTNICEEPLFQNKKRINELWDLRKSTTINKEMKDRQVLDWVNSLMGYFGLRVRKERSTVSLEVQHDVLGIVQRKNARGKFYEDANNWLKQESQDGDPFIDEETGETLIQRQERQVVSRMQEYDTSGLDAGIMED